MNAAVSEVPAQATHGLAATDFLAAQRANRRNTTCLIVILLFLGGGIGYLIGAVLELELVDSANPLTDSAISPIGVIFGGGMLSVGLIASAVTFAAGGSVILGITGAKDVSKDEEPMLHNLVEEMAIAAGLPKPRVAVIETVVPNAFATGMAPEKAAIGVTRGLLKLLSRDELQGVVGHEMAHIRNWDTRYMTAVAILVGLVALVCDGARRMLWSSGGKRRRRGGPLLLVFAVFMILAPIAAELIRFAVSRQREYLADAASVELTRNPLGLISALEKLSGAQVPFPGANRATQHMFIVNPFRMFDEHSSALLSTHPALALRIERLRNLGAG